MNSLELSIFSEFSNISKVEHFIERLFYEFSVSEKLRGKMTVPIIEAVKNAILFGNKRNSQRIVKLTVMKNDTEIVVTIEDEGGGFDFNNIPDPTVVSKAGRGVYMMQVLTDKLIFEENGAKIIMSFFNE